MRVDVVQFIGIIEVTVENLPLLWDECTRDALHMYPCVLFAKSFRYLCSTQITRQITFHLLNNAFR